MKTLKDLKKLPFAKLKEAVYTIPYPPKVRSRLEAEIVLTDSWGQIKPEFLSTLNRQSADGEPHNHSGRRSTARRTWPRSSRILLKNSPRE
jgi:hypothetical protein